MSANPQPRLTPYVVANGPMRRRGKLGAGVVTALLLLAVLLAPVFIRVAADGGLAYGTRCVNAPTGEKPESKLWFNDGRWWGSLFSEKAGAYHIFTLEQDSWRDTGVSIDDRPGSKSDTLWDPGTRKLYVASHMFVDVGEPTSHSSVWGRLYRFSYDAAKKTYSLDDGFPVVISRGLSETMVLAKDSVGRFWITYVENSRVMLNHSNGDDKVWSTPFVLPVTEQAVNLTTDDISSIIAFGGNKVGVMWSNQATMKMYFSVHADSDAPGKWSTEEVAYPDSADDHINLKTDAAGNVYAAVKTSFEKKNEPLVLLLVRTPAGQWTNHVFGYVHDHHTRPIVVIDEAERKLHMFATAGGENPGAEAGGSIYHKSANLDGLRFTLGLGEPLIENVGDPVINNATSSKQNVVPGMGILVLASDKSTHRYVHNMIPPPGRLSRDR